MAMARMDVSRFCFILFYAAICLLHMSTFLHGQFIPAGSSIASIAQRSTITVSQFCGDEIQCRSRLDRVKCQELQVCQEVQNCTGRKGFPHAEDALLKWKLTNQNMKSCSVGQERPTDPPSALSMPDNAAMLTVDNSGSSSADAVCFLGKDGKVGNVFSLTFWMKGDCTNCTVVDLHRQGEESLAVRVVDGNHICINETCNHNEHLQKDQWEFIALTLYNRVITFYIGDIKVTEVNYPVDEIDIGSKEVYEDSVFNVLHAQYFEDLLTLREIKEMKTGLVDPTLGDCRCPPDYPSISDKDNSVCENAKGGNYPRFNSSIEFKGPDVILEESRVNWASAEQGPVTLTLNLSLSYQIETIEIGFVQPPPAQVTYRLISGGQERESQNFDCSAKDKCIANLGSLKSSSTLEQFEDRIAEGMKIVLNRDNNDDVRSFILSRIKVTGRCDCHGNAASCTSNGNTYSCACDPSTNTKGQHCRSCQANYFRKAGDFDCDHSCQCFEDGVADSNDQCDENGGNCICKEHVGGRRCDQCKPWTFNLDGLDSKGCTACPCYQSGSQSCNNVTGECTCKKNMAPPNCHRCLDNHYGFSSNNGCTACNCMIAGTVGQALSCNDQDGQCLCKQNVEGRSCDLCKAGSFNLNTPNLSGCEMCDCNPVGMDNSSCHQSTGQCACRGGIITDRTCSPEITSVEPTYGPLVGSTRITIHGKLLGNFTRSVSVYLGNVEQSIRTVNDSAIILETKQHSSLTTVNLNVGWVGIASTLKAPESFSYKIDPVLDDSKTVKGSSFVSGGCTVKLFGENLKSVKSPRLEVRHKHNPGNVASSKCFHKTDLVQCQTPNTGNLYSSPSDVFEMSAVFDGVSLNLGDVDIKPDPVVNSVGNIEFQSPFEDTISISGKNLLSACETNTYRILLGAIHCMIKHISDTGIECEPPTTKPEGPEKLPIVVSIGNIRHSIGTLEYLKWYQTTYFIIIVSIVCGIFAIIIIGCVTYRVRRRGCRRSQRKNSVPGLTKNGNSNDPYHCVRNQQSSNAYTELSGVTNNNGGSSGHIDVIRVESVFLEPKKGIVNTAAETNVFEDELLPFVEPGLKANVTDSFIGGSSFGVGALPILTGRKAKLVDGTLQRQRHSGQKLIIKRFIDTIQENLQSDGQENNLLVPWAQQVLTECMRFKKYKHNHLLHFIGLGLEQQRIHIMYEHMSKGTLKNVVSDTEQDYSVRKLLGFSQQVAEGIAFLASKDITHKDIASRNCMVDDFSMVKLGDAAFGWDFYPQEYVYHRQRERYLPLRWMAPESIDHGYYDMRTDVWSFGILVWELLTRGCLPFHEVSDSDLTQYILDGYRLGKPETISDNLYNLLCSCWSSENEGRPSIAAISSALCNKLETDDNNTYANTDTPRIRASSELQFYSSTDVSGV